MLGWNLLVGDTELYQTGDARSPASSKRQVLPGPPPHPMPSFETGNPSKGFPGGSKVKNPPVDAGDIRGAGGSLAREDPLMRVMATHSSILAWRILWTEEPGGLPSTG